MIKKIAAIVMVSLISILLAQPASACMLKLSAEQKAPQAGGEDVITVQFIQTHRNCSIKPEETKIETQGMKIVSQSEWENVRAGVYECTFKVAYPEKGEAVFKAERICPKGGITKKLNILVQ
jgi:hypothetical protein